MEDIVYKSKATQEREEREAAIGLQQLGKELCTPW
jgi:hypothetical protein